MASGVKFRAYPNKEQSAVLNRWIGCQLFVYNSKVAEDRYFRTFRNHALALTGLQTPVDQQYSQFKDGELTPWLFEVPPRSCVTGRTASCRHMHGSLKDCLRDPHERSVRADKPSCSQRNSFSSFQQVNN